MTKRLTKEQRKEQEIVALEKRLFDIYTTANRGKFGEGDAVFPDNLVLIVTAIVSLWDLKRDSDPGYTLLAHWNIDEYENPRRAAEFMHRNGLRA